MPESVDTCRDLARVRVATLAASLELAAFRGRHVSGPLTKPRPKQGARLAALLRRFARILGCGIHDILGESGGDAAARRPGPVGKLQRVFEQARSLPRRDQELVAKFIATLVEQRKAS